jgi:hypothetical protein
MEKRYEVIIARQWRRDDGRTASIYGSCPWWGDSEAARWHIERTGWTVRDNKENTVGMCRPPFKTEDEAREFAARLNYRMAA